MMTDEVRDRHLEAMLGRPEGGRRPAERATDLYRQERPGEPFLFVSRRHGLSPVEAVEELAEAHGTTPRIVRNLLKCDLWRLEDLTQPYRLATVWRAPDDAGELPPVIDALEVEQ